MKKRVLFLHSAGKQRPNEGSDKLRKYLQQKLDQDYRLTCPMMPDPEKPEYEKWKRQLEKALDLIDDEIILIGHSLGGSVLLKYFSEMPYHKPVTGLFIIAAPFWGEGGWELSEFELKKNFEAHLAFIPKIILYHSQDDESVPFGHLFLYAKKLPDALVRKFDHRGHTFTEPFPELIKDIKAI
jgi:uncharacterized protein